MSDRLFLWDENLDGNSGSHQFNTLGSQFGDGYVQSISVGINNRKGIWPWVKTAKKPVIVDIKNFLDDHKAVGSFLWDSPLDGQIRVKAADYQVENRGAGLYRISTTFTQVFHP